MIQLRTNPSVSSLLRTLRCPYCGSALEPAYEVAASRSEPMGAAEEEYAVLRCACYEYPVVSGIPIIQQVEGLGGVVATIKARDGRAALLRALDLFRVKWANRTRWHRFRYDLACRRLLRQEGGSFERAASLVRKPQIFADYLFHRYANPSFLAAVGLLQLLGQMRGRPTPRVLDLACGAGHSSFLIRHLYPELSVVAVDHDFVSLYLARRFVAPGAVHLCVDAEVPTPFADDTFDAVFCLDAFHYLRAKNAVVSELSRVSTADSLWLFPHLHNVLQHNITAGIPLSPEMYLECFSGAAARLFDETTILHDLCERHVLDLRPQRTAAELGRCRTLTLVRGPGCLWADHRQFPSLLCREPSSLVVNPIYRRQRSGDELRLALEWPNPLMRRECGEAEAVLPRSCTLRLAELERLRDEACAADHPRLAELVGKFVLVPLPARYARGRRGD